jgi:hypothetical protein
MAHGYSTRVRSKMLTLSDRGDYQESAFSTDIGALTGAPIA